MRQLGLVFGGRRRNKEGNRGGTMTGIKRRGRQLKGHNFLMEWILNGWIKQKFAYTCIFYDGV